MRTYLNALMPLAEVELKPAARPTREATGAAPLLLEELCERMLAICEGVTTLLGHGIHRVLAIVETLPQLWV